MNWKMSALIFLCLVSGISSQTSVFGGNKSVPPLSKPEISDFLGTLRSQSSEPSESNAQLKITPYSIKVGGVNRSYYVHAPAGSKVPLPVVLVFHGATGKARQMPRLTGMNAVADKFNFIAVYPESTNGLWIQGIRSTDTADLAFVEALLKKLGTDYKVDSKRIYTSGMSNGGFFSQFLIARRPDLVAAAASVSATMEKYMHDGMKPLKPASIIFFHGDDDTVVPFDGGSLEIRGDIDSGGEFRKVVSAEKAVQYWIGADKCNPKPIVSVIPDIKPFDGTHVTRKQFTGGTNGSEVSWFIIKDGGHTWPSGWQYMPSAVIGLTTHNINASEEIWKFFQRHHL